MPSRSSSPVLSISKISRGITELPVYHACTSPPETEYSIPVVNKSDLFSFTPSALDGPLGTTSADELPRENDPQQDFKASSSCETSVKLREQSTSVDPLCLLDSSLLLPSSPTASHSTTVITDPILPDITHPKLETLSAPVSAEHQAECDSTFDVNHRPTSTSLTVTDGSILGSALENEQDDDSAIPDPATISNIAPGLLATQKELCNEDDNRSASFAPEDFKQPTDDPRYKALRDNMISRDPPSCDPRTGWTPITLNNWQPGVMMAVRTFTSGEDCKNTAKAEGLKVKKDKKDLPLVWMECRLCRTLVHNEVKTIERHCNSLEHTKHLASIYMCPLAPFRWKCPLCGHLFRHDQQKKHRRECKSKLKSDTGDENVEERPHKRPRVSKTVNEDAKTASPTYKLPPARPHHIFGHPTTHASLPWATDFDFTFSTARFTTLAPESPDFSRAIPADISDFGILFEAGAPTNHIGSAAFDYRQSFPGASSSGLLPSTSRHNSTPLVASYPTSHPANPAFDCGHSADISGTGVSNLSQAVIPLLHPSSWLSEDGSFLSTL
ncbi:hypothetical protein EIP86_008204 [Pleurotus ostreatoroseus]|nr:hypothetical protein EIP86_008204 [Pleurotus ostreatoroseus]